MNNLDKLWKLVTQPSSTLSDSADRRRAELLAGLTFFFAVLNVIGLVFGSRSGNMVGSMVLIILAVALILAYILSRSRHYRLGVWVALGIWTFVTFGYALSGRTTNGPLFAFAIFLPLVLVFGTAWLDLPSLAVYLGVVLTGYLLSPLAEPALIGRQYYLLFGILICLGGLLLVTQNYRDLVEHERLEILRVSEARLRGIIESTPDIILETDRNGRITLINRHQETYLHRNIRELILPQDLPGIEAVLDQAFATGVQQSLEVQTHAVDGSIAWDSVRVGPITPHEDVTNLAVVITDITKRKQAEVEREQLIAELESRNAELERYSYSLSHELKSPLVTIQGFLGLLEQSLIGGRTEQVNKDVGRIAAATENMSRLIEEMLELARVGRQMNPPEVLSFEEVVQEGVERAGGRIAARKIAVNVQTELPVVHGDRARLIEVVQNLVDNAAKYMGEQSDPRIEIGYRGLEDGRQVFYVRDNGIGIAPEYHEQVFGLFNKLNATSEGTGVGLALVKRIIEYHGGRIWVESNAGEGSTFYFTLAGAPES